MQVAEQDSVEIVAVVPADGRYSAEIAGTRAVERCFEVERCIVQVCCTAGSERIAAERCIVDSDSAAAVVEFAGFAGSRIVVDIAADSDGLDFLVGDSH